VAVFVQSFAFWYAVEKLFQRSIGLSNALITVATVVYVVVMAAGTIPFGMVADRGSRKHVLMVASLLLAAASAICGSAHGFWVYTIGLAVWGLFFAAYAGTYDSIVFDTVREETGSADGYERLYGRVRSLDAVAMIAGALATSVLVHVLSLRATFYLTIPVTLLSLPALAAFSEPVLHKAAVRERSVVHVRLLFRALARGPVVVAVAVAMVGNAALMRLLMEFHQLWWISAGLSTALFGLCFALLYVGQNVGAFLAGRWAARTIPAAVCCAAAGALFVHRPALVVAAMTVMFVAVVMLDVALSRRLHDEMPDNIRAGVSSTVSTLSMVVFIPLALGFGAASGSGALHASWFALAPALGTCAAVVVLSVLVRRTPADHSDRPRRGDSDARADAPATATTHVQGRPLQNRSNTGASASGAPGIR
jgi:MFS family permease